MSIEAIEGKNALQNAVCEAVEAGMSEKELRRAIIDGIQTVMPYEQACQYIDRVLTPHK